MKPSVRGVSNGESGLKSIKKNVTVYDVECRAAVEGYKECGRTMIDGVIYCQVPEAE